MADKPRPEWAAAARSSIAAERHCVFRSAGDGTANDRGCVKGSISMPEVLLAQLGGPSIADWTGGQQPMSPVPPLPKLCRPSSAAEAPAARKPDAAAVPSAGGNCVWLAPQVAVPNSRQ
ncbi:hypothetical protein ACCO45_013615 [Purpureocillium lilacinum]|uniref:Uncharacterized protein n=1 Tax=Purpureocillium lilacinum TaxID=33203 RepID=A0ACC4D744_PURLI